MDYKKNDYTMKGFKRLFSAVAVLAVTVLTFVSCNRDSVAQDLDNRFDNSYWEGTITQTTFQRHWGSVTSYQTVSYIDLKFNYNPNTYSSGTGQEYSYDNNGYGYLNNFNFTVREDVRYDNRSYQKFIDMSYANGDRMQIYLYNYVYGQSFTGRVINNGVDIGDCYFRLVNTYRPYRSDWSSWRSRSGAGESKDSVAVDSVKHQ